ncbi:MAG: diacylglycerol kinase family protein [Candidatus Aenigmatarchaeota archaeon]
MFNIHLKEAFEGIWKIITTQRTFKVMLAIALITIIAAFYFDFNRIEWLILIIMINLVLTSEMLNTAIEFLSDRVNNKYDSKIKVVKDISAGAVLTASITSVIVGIILFYPKILIFLK